MKTNILYAVAAMAGLAAGGANAATLLGDTVTQSFVPGYGDQSVAPVSAIVGAGTEFTLSIGSVRGIFVDIFSDYILLTYNNVSNAGLSGSPSILTLSGLDFGAGIGGLTLSETDTGTLGGFGGNTGVFTANSIELTLSGVWSDTDQLRVDLSEVAAVPLPAALPLLGFALAGLWGVGRRKTS